MSSMEKKLIVDSDSADYNERAIDVMALSYNDNNENTATANELCKLLTKLDVKNLLLTHDQIAERSRLETLERQESNQLLMLEQESDYSSRDDEDEENSDCTLKMLENTLPNYDNIDGKAIYEKLNNEVSFECAIGCEQQPENDFTPVLSAEGKYLLEKANHYAVENLKLVNIEKGETPLGATIRNRDGSIVIGRIVNGGSAEKSGLLHEEDEILEINNVPVRGKTINDICDMLVSSLNFFWMIRIDFYDSLIFVL